MLLPYDNPSEIDESTRTTEGHHPFLAFHRIHHLCKALWTGWFERVLHQYLQVLPHVLIELGSENNLILHCLPRSNWLSLQPTYWFHIEKCWHWLGYPHHYEYGFLMAVGYSECILIETTHFEISKLQFLRVGFYHLFKHIFYSILYYWLLTTTLLPTTLQISP